MLKLSLSTEERAILVAIAVILAGMGITEVSALLHFTVGVFLGAAVAFLGLIMTGGRSGMLRRHRPSAGEVEDTDDVPYTGD